MPIQRKSDWSESNPGGGHLNVPDLPAEDKELLRLLCEQVTIPLDQLSRFTGSTISALEAQIRRLESAYCVVSGSFPGEKYVWVRATRLGRRCVGLSGSNRAPVLTMLNHHRGVNEARLVMSKELSRGRWISEGVILRDADRRPREIPDGVFEVDGLRWAVEVELSRKHRRHVQQRVESLLDRYDRVVYFCAPLVMSCVRAALPHFPSGRLEVREAIAAEWQEASGRYRKQDKRRPTLWERALLCVVLEEGTIAVDQLAVLAGCKEKTLCRDLAEMERCGLVEQGFQSTAPFGWVWATSWGGRTSGMDMAFFRQPGPSRLPHRRALMSVRLALTEEYRWAYWVARRMLAPDAAVDMPREMGLLVRRRMRIAVTVSLDEVFRLKATMEMLARLSGAYDAVWWYCAPIPRAQLLQLVAKGGWKNVEVRDLPEEPPRLARVSNQPKLSRYLR